MGPDSDESVEDQVTESSEGGDERTKAELYGEAQDRDIAGRSSMDKGELGDAVHASEALDSDGGTGEGESGPPPAEMGSTVEGGERAGLEDTSGPEFDAVTESPGARARAEGEAERAQRLAEARHAGEPVEVDTAELVCTVHGGELRQAPGKYRWICDRVQEPGDCVAGYRE